MKCLCTALFALVMLAACQPAPQPVITLSPTPTLRAPTDTLPPTATATTQPTATSVPTVAPTATPAALPTLVPTAMPTVQPTPTPTASPVLQVQVNSPDVGYVNIRAAPATSGELVAQAKDQAMLDVLEPLEAIKAKVGQQGQWIKVRLPDGKQGYAAAWYLQLPGASPTLARQPTVATLPELSGAELDLFNRVNALRTQNGLAPYRFANRLAAAAQRHSQDMADTGNVNHTGSDGSTAKQRIMDTGYGDWPTEELIYGGTAKVEDVWAVWMADPALRSILLSPKLVDAGLAMVKGKANLYYYTIDLGARPVQTVGLTLAPTPASPALDVITDLLNRTNTLRAQNGLPSYKLNDLLNASAQRHSEDMAATGRIDHTGSDKSTAKQRVLDTGYEAQLVGENIYGGQVTMDDAWDYWVNDPPHRAVLLNAQYVDIGISVVKGKGGWYYFTMDVAMPTR